MNKTWLVLKHELRVTILRPSFLVLLFLLPVVGFIVFMVASNLQGSSSGEAVAEFFAPSTDVGREGYVDQSGVLQVIPAKLEGRLIEFTSAAEAESALQAGSIQAYYLIPSDYLQKGEIEYVRADYNPLGGLELTTDMDYFLTYNLLKGNETLVERISHPTQYVEWVMQTENGSAVQPERDPAMAFSVPYAVTLLFYITIFGSASLMLNSVSNEKKNRALEMLMTSITPTQMLTGKIIALGVAGLLQTVVWSVSGWTFMRLGGGVFPMFSNFQLPLSVLMWGVVFFLLGYTVYASMMAGVGALAPNLREASQATFLLVIPLVIPMMLISVLANRPDSWVSVLVSLFPLTAPVGMMARLAAGEVPLWQILLSVALLLGTAALLVRSAAGMFRAQSLLSGAPFKVKVFLRALFGKA